MHYFALFALIFSASCATRTPTELRKAWIKIETPEEISALAHASCFAAVENFYVFSGIDEQGEGPLNNVGYTYDLKGRTWKKWNEESGPNPTQNFSALKVDDSLYVFGGQDFEHPNGSNDFWKFSLKENRWETLPKDSKVDERWKATIALSSQRLIVHGGKGSEESLNTVEYDLKSSTWRTLKIPKDLGSRVAAMVASYQDKVFIFGGFKGTDPQDSAFLLNAKEESWTKIANPLLGARANAKSIIQDSRLYILGGAKDFITQEFGAVYDFDLSTWTAIPKIENFVDYKGFEITKIEGEGILLWGGRHPSSNSYNNKIYFYRFRSKDWRELMAENPPPGTIGGCLTSNSLGDVFALGGIMPAKGRGLKHSDGLWILSKSKAAF